MKNLEGLSIRERLINLLDNLVEEQFLNSEIKKEIEAIFPCSLFF
jgi:hypothetical protein